MFSFIVVVLLVLYLVAFVITHNAGVYYWAWTFALGFLGEVFLLGGIVYKKWGRK